MVHDREPQKPCKVNAPSPVVPEPPRNARGHEESEEESQEEEPLVLPIYHAVLLEVAGIYGTGSDVRFREHPAYVRPPQTAMSSVRVEVGVSVAVM